MQQGSVAQANCFVGLALVVDEKRELDAGFIAEEPGIADVTQPDGRNVCAFLFEFFFKCAQLRDMLAAKNSTVVAQENQYGWSALPQRAQARCLAFGIWQRNSSEFAAVGLSHAGHSLASRVACQVSGPAALRLNIVVIFGLVILWRAVEEVCYPERNATS
jgi:hypothetical protein